jgi:hypothetical protein
MLEPHENFFETIESVTVIGGMPVTMAGMCSMIQLHKLTIIVGQIIVILQSMCGYNLPVT